MNSTQARLDSGKNRQGAISLPIMHIYAGCLLSLVLFFIYKYGSQITEMGLVPTTHLPITQVIECEPENIYTNICIDRKGNLSFGLPGPPDETQEAALKSVAAQHGVIFTPSQLIELKSLPFLAIEVEELPQLLSMPYNRRVQVIELAKYNRLSEAQLVECILASREFAKRRFRQPIVVSLRIDTEAKTGKIMRVIDALRNDGISSFKYQTQFDESQF